MAELGEPLPAPRPSLPHEVSIIAFHSFKGGVGRTLHCVAAARRLVEEGRRVLLVDADLEAPGITWMASEVTRIDFAYEDFLALVHGAMDEKYIDAVRLGQKFLTNQTLDGVVVMPARRDHTRVTPSPIEPIDLLTSERDPYVLTEALAELGHALQVDAVLIDLRAGASELSAPLLLDPRVHRVFVTTISDQSVRGTAQILRDLALRAPATRATDPDCALLLTQFSDQDHSERLLEVAAELRSAALAVSRRSDEAAISNQDTTDSDVAIAVMTSPFDSRLLNLPASWNSVVTLTARAGLSQVLTPLIEAMPGQPTQVATLVAAATPGTIDDTRNRLARVAADLVFADSSEEADFLATEALRNLAEAHRTELPIEIVIGSKGAGKTFTYLQLCRRPDWSSFIDATGIRASSLQVPTVPVLASSNLADPALINERRAAAAHRLTGQEPANSQAIRDMVTEALALELTPVGWRRVWLACFARAIGIPATSETAEDELTSFARRQSAIFVLDGLEDLFQEFVESQHEQRALRALLVECPEWLRTLRGRPLGMVAFVRRDLAQAALRQNFAQFEKRYEKYSLRWNREEALRLAAWVCQRGGALDVANNEVRSASEDHLSELMLAAWGEKMGTLKSKEARSEVWFFAALSDFRQQVQARDIVSFLATAADESVGSDSRWSDRVLTPTAMRNALPVCSQQKIEAIRLENRPVGVLLDRLQALDIEQKKLPFQLDAVGLDSEQAQLLDANGVLFREDNQYWIPEIFRHGLGFTVPGGRRPRVIAVANLVRRRNNLAG
ncbi:AAA family ATPase [Micromonospora sp. NPDC005197]|uniref:KGGVGR-motif variant AAA ATPase n=1 Tax=Micromonospora sp. NPDC005197 TaxID=3157020 RepID=UPI0033BB4056